LGLIRNRLNQYADDVQEHDDDVQEPSARAFYARRDDDVLELRV
jgi:hypothetical protein